MARYDCMKHLTILVGALLISISSMAQMYLWQGGQPTSADLDSITFTYSSKADDAFTIVENTLSMYEGATYTLTMEGNIYSANQYHWASGNTRVATVDENGTITAKQQGMTLITATYGRHTQMCILTVFSLEGDVKITPTTLRLLIGYSEDILVHFEPSVIPPTITWKSLDPTIAQVDTTGKVTALKEGKTKVIVEYGKRADTCQVIVFNLSVQLNIIDITQKKCTVAVTPFDEESYYYCGYTDAATMGDMSDSELTENVLANLQNMIDQYASVGYNVTLKDLLLQGTKTLIASGMTASTDYVMFAFGIDVETETASPVVTRVPFRTLDVPVSNMIISIQYDSTAYIVNSKGKTDTLVYFAAQPSNNHETYLFNGALKSTLVENFNGDPAAFMQNMEAQYDKQGTLEKYLRTGVNKIYAKNPAEGSLWVLIAVGYDGGFTTKIFTYEYTYAAPKDGKPARLVRKDTEEDNVSELNVIPMMFGEEMLSKEHNEQVLPLPVGMMHL